MEYNKKRKRNDTIANYGKFLVCFTVYFDVAFDIEKQHLSKKSEAKVEQQVIQKEDIVLTDGLTEIVNVAEITKNEVEQPDVVEIVLKDEKAHKGTCVVFYEQGKFVEFNKGKAKVNIAIKDKLEKIGVI